MISFYKFMGFVVFLAGLVALVVAPPLGVALLVVWVLLVLAVRSREKAAQHQEMLDAIRGRD
jgi:hypothetical protein